MNRLGETIEGVDGAVEIRFHHDSKTKMPSYYAFKSTAANSGGVAFATLLAARKHLGWKTPRSELGRLLETGPGGELFKLQGSGADPTVYFALPPGEDEVRFTTLAAARSHLGIEPPVPSSLALERAAERRAADARRKAERETINRTHKGGASKKG